ncbi:DNA topoisomerase IB [Amycolatopsis marina]|uniref:DNA topoisomerase n=1 Tax=Amycolatopsis marina TaxID=490629 RepID=A0A1I0XZ44_9PSEU|nr:DNA topoisomerase IB [Amycolatopsis marina]SFB06331.1 DNA topoisomerase IB [Amycolatopsis marina]
MRLRRSDPDAPGIRRQRCGRGFRYFAPDGSPLTDEETLGRIRHLVIPPAWREVWICPQPGGHIQAIGTDDAGRRQYLYHEKWRERRETEKHQRVLTLARKLPRFRASVMADLSASGVGRTRMLAAALRMLDIGIFRTGSEEYAEENGTYGVATLLRSHVTVRGDDELLVSYNAKGGLARSVRIRDTDLVRVVRAVRRARPPTDRLLAYRENGSWHEVHADDINNRFKELVGDQFTGKDLRTWNATVLAATAFAEIDRPHSQRGMKRAKSAVMREVAEELGNTPAVTRRSYVDPRVVRAFEQGITVRKAVARARAKSESDSGANGMDPAESMRTTIERAVVRMLSEMDPEPP